MGLTGAEAACTQIIAALKAGMAAKVGALNSEYGDAYVIAAPVDASYLEEIDPPLMTQVQYPAICVMADTDTPVGDALGDYYTTTHDIAVHVLVRDQRAIVRRKQLQRLTRAVKEIVGKENALALGGCKWRGTGWQTLTLTLGNDIVRGASSLFTVTSVEQA